MKKRGESLTRASGGLIQATFVAIVFVAWYLASVVWKVPALLLPDPTLVFASVAKLLSTWRFLKPLEITLLEVMASFALASVVGLACGYAVSSSTFLIDVFDPLLSSINAIPAILFFPLFALLFGLGSGSKIALGFTVGFFPIALNTIAGFASVDRTYIRAARSMGASKSHMMRYLLIPCALPVVTAGLRMGLILSFLSVIGGEMIASFAGLGHQIAGSSQAMDPEMMYAWILIVICLSVLLNLVLSRVSRWGGRA